MSIATRRVRLSSHLDRNTRPMQTDPIGPSPFQNGHPSPPYPRLALS